jgi:hypothetical protein
MLITMLPLAFYPSKAYFHLVESVDHCVFVSDGKYAARRVNRTKLPDDSWLTLPVAKPRRNQLPFDEAAIWWGENDDLHNSMIHQILDLYEANSPSESLSIYKNEVFMQIKKLPTYGNNLCHTLCQTTRGVMKYLNIQTRTSLASDIVPDILCGQRRAIKICKEIGADEFLQPEWTTRFFDRIAFQRQGIKLDFFEAADPEDLDISVLDSCLSWWNETVTKNL